MPFFIVELTDKPHTKRDGIDTMIVSAEDAVDSVEICKSQFTGFASDAAWDAATVTELSSVAAADADSMDGWRFQVSVATTPDPTIVEVVGDVTNDTLDEIGTALAVALNATPSITNAGYTVGTQTLIVAEGISDALGDLAVEVNVLPPLVEDSGGQVSQDVNIPGFVVSITDEGLASANLTVVLAADTYIVPIVLNKAQST